MADIDLRIRIAPLSELPSSTLELGKHIRKLFILHKTIPDGRNSSVITLPINLVIEQVIDMVLLSLS